jgi:Protein of unknown function (DUF3071)
MRELQLVAVSDDGTHLILRPEGDDVAMVLPVDERLHAAMRGDRARLGQLEIQMDSQVRPRDIQARIRGGESVESVAAAAAVSLDRVMRYAGPVLAEREYIAGRARGATVRRMNGDGPAPTLDDAIARWVNEIDIDPETVQWDAWRRDDGRWQISASWPDGSDLESARFAFDPAGRSVAPDDDRARAVAGDRPPELANPPGLTRLSVVARVAEQAADVDEEDDEDQAAAPAPNQVLILTDTSELTDSTEVDIELADSDPADEEPTGPIPVTGRRPRRGERRRPTGSSRALDDTTSERLRLTDIADRVEIELQQGIDEPATEAPAAQRAGSARARRPSVPSWDEIMFGGGSAPE